MTNLCEKYWFSNPTVTNELQKFCMLLNLSKRVMCRSASNTGCFGWNKASRLQQWLYDSCKERFFTSGPMINNCRYRLDDWQAVVQWRRTLFLQKLWDTALLHVAESCFILCRFYGYVAFCRYTYGALPPRILKFSAKKGCFLRLEWEKSNFTTFGPPWKSLGKIL